MTDLLKISELGDVTLSPDGRQVVYTVRTVVPEREKTEKDDQDRYAYRTHLYVVDATRREAPRPLTRGESSASDPDWHPDGDRIAFVRNVDDKPQIFVLPLLGGEAYQLTDIEFGASSPRWSPDGSRLLFSSSLTAKELRDRTGRGPEWPVERPGRTVDDTNGVRADPEGSIREIRAWLARNEADGNPRVFHRLNIQGETDLEDDLSYRHWFVVVPDSEAIAPVMITSGYFDFGGGEWLSDGAAVVLSGLMATDRHPDRVIDSDLYLARADGSGIEPLLSMDGYALSSPAVSPDGRAVAFSAWRTDDIGYAQREIGVFALDDASSARLLTSDFDRSASDPQWSPDGWYLYFTAASNGGFPLYRVPGFEAGEAADTTLFGAVGPPSSADSFMDVLESELIAGEPSDSVSGAADDADDEIGSLSDTLRSDSALTEATAGGPPVERLTSYERGIRSFDVGPAAIFYVATEVGNPYELYASNSPYTSVHALSDHNTGWISGKRLSFPESFVIERDGLDIQYWIMKPSFFDPSKTYALLHQIHGGPSAMWGPGEASMWHEFQFFASNGYGIVFSNPRGSGGYGYDFRRSNFQDWGEGPAGDVLQVAAEAASLPWVDTERQVVTGGSYAGYLTAWIVGRDDRFKAAVAQRGVYDLATFLGEGNAWRLVPSHFGGFPWDRDVDSTSFTDLPARSLPRFEHIADTTLVELWPDSDSLEQIDAISFGEAIDLPTSVSEILEHSSPLAYVDQIRTPLLIIHADQDLRTGVAQSETLYKSLKILERPVEYVRYPNSGHELSRSGDPRQRMDRILRIYEFMERFVH